MVDKAIIVTYRRSTRHSNAISNNILLANGANITIATKIFFIVYPLIINSTIRLILILMLHFNKFVWSTLFVE